MLIASGMGSFVEVPMLDLEGGEGPMASWGSGNALFGEVNNGVRLTEGEWTVEPLAIGGDPASSCSVLFCCDGYRKTKNGVGGRCLPLEGASGLFSRWFHD